MKDRSQEEIQITAKAELESGISKDQIDGFQKGGWSIPNGVNIIIWIVYVYYNITIACFEFSIELGLLVNIKFKKSSSQVENLGSDTKKILSRPASQNTLERRCDASWGCIYTRKIPHVYTLSIE